MFQISTACLDSQSICFINRDKAAQLTSPCCTEEQTSSWGNWWPARNAVGKWIQESWLPSPCLSLYAGQWDNWDKLIRGKEERKGRNDAHCHGASFGSCGVKIIKMILLNGLAKKPNKKRKKTRWTVIKTNRRKPESAFDLFPPKARYFGLVFILLLFCPLLSPLAGLPTTGNNKLGKTNPKLQLEEAGGSCCVRVGLQRLRCEF